MSSTDPVDDFDCGDKPLNDFLKRYALKNQERHGYSITYVALTSDDPPKIAGYYTLSTTSIPKVLMPESAVEGQPKYSQIPGILLCRYARDLRFKGKGIGDFLMRNCLKRTLSISKEGAGARYLITDAYNSAISTYESYGFVAIPGGSDPDTTKMYLDIMTIREAEQKQPNNC